MKFLRWIGVLPTAIFAYFAGLYFIKMTIWISHHMFAKEDRFWLAEVGLPIFAIGFGCYCYVRAGVEIAPKYKFNTSLILIALMLVIIIVLLILTTTKFNWVIIFDLISAVSGLIVACVEIKLKRKIKY